MDFIYWIGLAVLIYHLAILIGMIVFDCDWGMKFTEWFGKPIDELRGKVIWVTGASSGIGEELAVCCAKAGAKLVLTARRQNELERVKKICLETSRGKLKDKDVLIFSMDMLDMKSHQQSFDRVLEHFGRLDILVNNAGRSQRANWEETEIEVDRGMFELNVFAVVNLTRICVKYFIKVGSGHVAVTSSTVGLSPAPFSASYTASKHALHGYFNSLRLEKKGQCALNVTLFCPGPTFTNYLNESFTEKADVKLGQSSQPNDKKMTSERCAFLFALALANKIDEAWAAIFPILPLYYLYLYYSNIFRWALKKVNPNVFKKMRDGRDLLKEK